jgi:hypothetical protein
MARQSTNGTCHCESPKAQAISVRLQRNDHVIASAAKQSHPQTKIASSPAAPRNGTSLRVYKHTQRAFTSENSA